MADDIDVASTIAAAYRRVHDLVRAEIDGLDEEALNWAPGPETNSMRRMRFSMSMRNR